MTDNQIEITTPVCVMCMKHSTVKVSSSGYTLWKAGMHIQNAFPNLSSDEREMLMTGIHSKCWTEMMGSAGE